MALELQPVEIVFEGLDQKTDIRSTRPGMLVDAQNVVFNKTGQLAKRRGFERVDLANEAAGLTPETRFLDVGTFEDELVVFGTDMLYGLASLDSQINGTDAIVQRGPVLRGQYSIQYVIGSSLGSEV